jgi:hypothetical protein
MSLALILPGELELIADKFLNTLQLRRQIPIDE